MIYGTIVVDEARCKGCNLCVGVCPQDVLMLDADRINSKGYHPAILDETEAHCTGCAICAVICPDVCITVMRQPKASRTDARIRA